MLKEEHEGRVSPNLAVSDVDDGSAFEVPVERHALQIYEAMITPFLPRSNLTSSKAIQGTLEKTHFVARHGTADSTGLDEDSGEAER